MSEVYDLNCPHGTNPITYVTVHESAHAYHTYCMNEFQYISGWIAVRNWKASHPTTGAQIHLFEFGDTQLRLTLNSINPAIYHPSVEGDARPVNNTCPGCRTFDIMNKAAN